MKLTRRPAWAATRWVTTRPPAADELEDVNTRADAGAAGSFDERELEEARDVKEAAVVVGAKTAGATEVRSAAGRRRDTGD